MQGLGFHDPVSAWTHGAWFLLSVPATLWLLSGVRGNPVKQAAFAIFGVGLFMCYGGSTLWHTFHIEDLATLDYIGIFLLIAGTTTAVVLVVLRGAWRWGTLTYVWLLAISGVVVSLLPMHLPNLVYTCLYLGMGWGMCVCYFELVRVLGQRRMFLVILGGVWYSVGAVLNAFHWPVLIPGIFGSHELFHVFVMAGSLSHFLFMMQVLTPFRRPAFAEPVVVERSEPILKPRLALQQLQSETA
ncbi:MAG: hemolysin III family protein [Gemmataceae bacterium]